MSSRRLDELGGVLAPVSLSSRPPVARSEPSRIVAREFGVKIGEETASGAKARISPFDIPLLDIAPLEIAPFDGAAMRWLDSLLPVPGQIVLITGPSGAGKSSMLRALKNSAQHAGEIRWQDLSKKRLPARPVVDCFGRISLEKTLENLSRVGLAEVWTYLRTPAELSEGQRWRLRLALVLAKRKRAHRPIVVCDEFAAVLDRVSAAVVARTLRRAIHSASNISAIVATSHEDLGCALEADVVVRCDFGTVSVQKMTTDGTGMMNPIHETKDR